jgi:hypothetical protein
LRESETPVSTEGQEHSTRVSESQTGLPLSRETDGKLMLTLDKLGTTPWLTSTPNGPQCNSGERDKSQTQSNGSDSSSSVKAPHLDFSTTRSQPLGGTDTEAISITQRMFFTLSPTPTSSPKLASVLILPLQKVEPPGLENMKPYPSSLQRSSRRRTSSTHINFQSKSPRSHTSKESGPPTDKPL